LSSFKHLCEWVKIWQGKGKSCVQNFNTLALFVNKKKCNLEKPKRKKEDILKNVSTVKAKGVKVNFGPSDFHSLLF